MVLLRKNGSGGVYFFLEPKNGAKDGNEIGCNFKYV